MSCPLNPADCVSDVIGSSVGDVVSSAWDSICQSFADAASNFLTSFANAFANFPDPNVSDPGLRNVYGVSLGIAAVIAALLLLGQVIRTAYSQEGRSLAVGLVGVARTALACLLTLVIGGTALAAANELTTFIIKHTYGSEEAFTKKLGTVFAWDGASSGAILLVMGCVGILLTAVLWFEMLLRNAALAVLLATAPLAAAGQVSEGTSSWWSKSVSATVQLIVLKPLIALVMFLGFSLSGESTGIANTISGMLILLLAVLAWPAVARFFTFASVSVAGGAGLGALIGAGAGAMSGGGLFGGSGARSGGPGSGGTVGGVAPAQFSQQTEARTMGSGSGDGTEPPPLKAGGAWRAGAGSAAASGAKSAGVKQALGAAAGPAAMALQVTQKAVNSLTGRMEAMAGHAGVQGANPHAQPAGRPPIMQENMAGRSAPTSGGPAGGSPPSAPAATPPLSTQSPAQSSATASASSAAQSPQQATTRPAPDPASDTAQPTPPVPPVERPTPPPSTNNGE